MRPPTASGVPGHPCFCPASFKVGERSVYVPLRVDDSLEWLTALREVLSTHYYSLLLKIQIMTSRMKRHTKPVWDGRDLNAELLCGTLPVESRDASPSRHTDRLPNQEAPLSFSVQKFYQGFVTEE